MKCVWVLLAVCLLTASMSAEANRWTRASPLLPGGEPSAVAVSPAGVLFAASNAGLFQSADGGKTWGPVNIPGGLFVRTLAFDGTATVYAGTRSGLLRSDDGGLSWKSVNYLPGISEFSVVVAGGGFVYALSGSLYRSVDKGESWIAGGIGLRDDYLFTLAVDPTAGSTVYAAGYDGLYKSTDAGASWALMLNPTPIGGVFAVAVDPADPKIVYAVGAGMVFRSDDAAAHWVRISDPLGPVSNDIYTLVVDASSALYAVTFHGLVYRTPDGGTTWSQLDVDRADGLAAADPSSPSTIVLGLTPGDVPVPGGLVRTTDGGVTWNSTNAPMPSFVVSDLVFGGQPGDVYALNQQVEVSGRTIDGSIWKTTDGGETWSSANSGLVDPSPDVSNPVAAIAADSSPAPALYAAVGGSVFKSTDGAAHWFPASTGLPGSDDNVHSLAVDPADPNTVYAASAGIYKSTDGGSSWSRAGSGPVYPAVVLVVDPVHHGNLYAVGYFGALSKSEDFGATWRTIYSVHDEVVRCVAVDPAAPATVYAGIAEAFNSGDGHFGKVVKSTDGGATWVTSSGGLPTPDVYSIVVDSGNSTVLYAATSSGVYRSRDSGATWLPFQRGVSGSAQKIAQDRASPSTLFLGAAGGLFRAAVDGRGACSADVLRLCLGDRFQAQVSFRKRASGQQQDAQALTVTRDSGTFGFGPIGAVGGFADVTLKVLDARSIDGRFWVFGGGLSDLEYSVEITDTQSGATTTWRHDEGPVASFVDTGGFAQGAESTSAPGSQALSRGLSGGRRSNPTADRAAGSTATCIATGTRACLLGRFAVQVQWRPPAGSTGSALAADVSYDADAAFSFFEPSNVELVVKMIDGRGTNGTYWVFVGSLTNVEFTLTVTDTLTGTVKTYFNPQGELASVADTSAF